MMQRVIMDPNALYDRWRESRSQIDPPEGFVEGVMESIGATALTNEPQSRASRISDVLQAGACAAAALAALFRVAELLSLFVTSRIEN
jgi:hypothetical protein